MLMQPNVINKSNKEKRIMDPLVDKSLSNFGDILNEDYLDSDKGKICQDFAKILHYLLTRRNYLTKLLPVMDAKYVEGTKTTLLEMEIILKLHLSLF